MNIFSILGFPVVKVAIAMTPDTRGGTQAPATWPATLTCKVAFPKLCNCSTRFIQPSSSFSNCGKSRRSNWTSVSSSGSLSKNARRYQEPLWAHPKSLDTRVRNLCHLLMSTFRCLIGFTTTETCSWVITWKLATLSWRQRSSKMTTIISQ